MTKSNVPVRAKDESTQLLLQGAVDGDLEYIHHVRQTKSVKFMQGATCISGCTILHWAAGSNRISILEYLLKGKYRQNQNEKKTTTSNFSPIFTNVDLPVTRSKKSDGRTPLHYSCRNGHLDSVKYLIFDCGANPTSRAKHGVTPFQLAIWQNHFEVCQFLVSQAGINPATDYNDFHCSPIHWIGICPVERANYNSKKYRKIDDYEEKTADSSNNDDDYDDGRDLLPLARWLLKQPGVDHTKKQRQNHTALHKAGWGGHLKLVEYLHIEWGMMDDTPDTAGNYAASLADMVNTKRHDRVAQYLRQECSMERIHSCTILGVSTRATIDEIRQAYLTKARQFHPDRQHNSITKSEFDDSENNTSFQDLHRAYKHLIEEQGRGNQKNPAHSLNLMLQVSGTDDNRQSSVKIKGNKDSCFKARLIAVLLEYGDKGMDVSNIKKKWLLVWGPDIPFPSQYETDDDNAMMNGTENNNGRRKRLSLSNLLLKLAGDVIRIDKDEEGGLRVFPTNCSREKVNEAAQYNCTIKEKEFMQAQ